MSLDRDLRDALQPLAGDPVADAARVLAALPPMGPGVGPGSGPRPDRHTPRGGKPFPWWWVSGALVLGMLLGYAIAQLHSPEPPRSMGPAKKEPEAGKDPWQSTSTMPPAMGEVLDVMAFGKIDVVEPGKERQTLRAGDWRADLGAEFATGDGMAGIYVYGTDARVRLDRVTVAAIDVDDVALAQGRLWLSTIERPHTLRVDLGIAVVQADAVEVVAERDDDAVSLAVLDGRLSVRTKGGEARKVEAGTRITVDARAGIGKAEAIPFAGSLTGWMAPMVLQQQDETELRQRLDAMTSAYLAGTYRDEAALELRRLGARAVAPLFLVLDKLVADPELLHRTAQLIADVADFTKVDWLFAMLERGDAETRAIAFAALARVTATAVEDAAFWRDAPPAAREDGLRRWRAQIR